ncbi:MAG: hypothetical protein K8I30_16250 [Anaerolineae bacterium]|nr:hypothetical protein [Anaerolineae bacterium]
MSAERNFTDLDYERLSAYLDGALTDTERAELESRLQTDDGLRRELDALRQTVNLVRALPPLKAPRNFTLTPAMVRPRTARWLIFPTSAAFSTISAAAATVLILLGAGMLLLQGNALRAPSFGAPPAVVQQESASQIAALPTEMPPSEKTAERELQNQMTQSAEAGYTILSTAPPSPSPAAASGAAAPENSAATSPIQPPAAGTQVPPASVTSDDGTGSLTASEPTLDEENTQTSQAAAPIDSTMNFAATMSPATALAFSPGAADAASQTGSSTQLEQQDANAQPAAAEIMTDQLAIQITGTAAATFGGDILRQLTATPAVETFAPEPTGTPMPRPTLVPTMTTTSSPTATASSTPASTQTPSPLPAQDGRTSTVQIAPADLLTWGALIVGVLLLVVAAITTIIRRRG